MTLPNIQFVGEGPGSSGVTASVLEYDTRVTSDGDTRVTSTGNTRVTQTAISTNPDTAVGLVGLPQIVFTGSA